MRALAFAAVYLCFLLFGFSLGYTTDRPEEIESTRPIAFRYEITPDAAKFLVLRDAPKCGPLQ